MLNLSTSTFILFAIGAVRETVPLFSRTAQGLILSVDFKNNDRKSCHLLKADGHACVNWAKVAVFIRTLRYTTLHYLYVEYYETCNVDILLFIICMKCTKNYYNVYKCRNRYHNA